MGVAAGNPDRLGRQSPPRRQVSASAARQAKPLSRGLHALGPPAEVANNTSALVEGPGVEFRHTWGTKSVSFEASVALLELSNQNLLFPSTCGPWRWRHPPRAVCSRKHRQGILLHLKRHTWSKGLSKTRRCCNNHWVDR